MAPDDPIINHHLYSLWNNWLFTSGKYVLNWEEEQFQHIVLFFQSLLISKTEYSKKTFFQLIICGNAYRFYQKNNIRSSWTIISVVKKKLPFISKSFDLVILPHTLEFLYDPNVLLYEVYRVLVPGGKIIVSGFNSISLLSFQRYWRCLFKTATFPQRVQSINTSKMKNHLKAINFNINYGKFGCYSFLLNNTLLEKRLSFLEKAGSRWWPTLGAIFIISGNKN